MDDLNATRVQSVNVYAHCEGPDQVRDTRDAMEVLCEPCAPAESGRDTGLAAARLNAMVRYVWTLPYIGRTKAEVHEAVQAIMDPDDDGDRLDLELAGMPAWASGLFEHDTRFVPLDGGPR